MMTFFEKRPVCSGDLAPKELETVIRGGVNAAVLKACAEVCLRCGKRLYSGDSSGDSRR